AAPIATPAPRPAPVVAVPDLAPARGPHGKGDKLDTSPRAKPGKTAGAAAASPPAAPAAPAKDTKDRPVRGTNAADDFRPSRAPPAAPPATPPAAAPAMPPPAATPPPTKQQLAEAKKFFEAGNKLMKDQLYQEALASFVEANRTAPRASIQQNIAFCYRMMKD